MKEDKEIYALTQDDAGSLRIEDAVCWTASVTLLAYVNAETAELKQEKKVLQQTLSEKENQKAGKSFHMEKETIFL